MPYRKRGSAEEVFGSFSFDSGPVHFVVANSEMDGRYPWSELTLWLEGDLRAVDRERTPWVVILMHRPVWSGKCTPNEAFKALEAVFLSFRVDLCVYGHHHYAEASCPLRGGKCVSKEQREKEKDMWDGPVHILIGHGGHNLGTLPDPFPEFSKWHAREWGFATLEAFNSSAMEVTFWGDGPLDNPPPRRHSLWIKRREGVPRVPRSHWWPWETADSALLLGARADAEGFPSSSIVTAATE